MVLLFGAPTHNSVIGALLRLTLWLFPSTDVAANSIFPVRLRSCAVRSTSARVFQSTLRSTNRSCYMRPRCDRTNAHSRLAPVESACWNRDRQIGCRDCYCDVFFSHRETGVGRLVFRQLVRTLCCEQLPFWHSFAAHENSGPAPGFGSLHTGAPSY